MENIIGVQYCINTHDHENQLTIMEMDINIGDSSSYFTVYNLDEDYTRIRLLFFIILPMLLDRKLI